MKSKPASTPPCTAPDELCTTGPVAEPVSPAPATPAAGVRGAWTAGRAPPTLLSTKDARIDALYDLAIGALILLGIGIGTLLLVEVLNLR